MRAIFVAAGLCDRRPMQVYYRTIRDATEQRSGKISRYLIGSGAIPVWLKVFVTVWAAVLVPSYAIATPLGLLWFCNVAIILTVVGLWWESSLLISIAALGSVVIMLLWSVYMLALLVLNVTATPLPFDLGTYMLDVEVPTSNRILSLYHTWLPIVLLFALRRLGYDRRGLPIQIGLTCILILLAFLLTPDLKTPAGNVNMVFGLSDIEPQAWVNRGVWLLIMMAVWAVWYIPAHLIFRRLFPPDASR